MSFLFVFTLLSLLYINNIIIYYHFFSYYYSYNALFCLQGAVVAMREGTSSGDYRGEDTVRASAVFFFFFFLIGGR